MELKQKRFVLTSLGCIAAATLAISVAVGGIGNVQASEKTAQESPTYAELVEMYPDQYNTAMTSKMDDEGEDNSHASFEPLMETPALRDVSGAIVREVASEDNPDFTPVMVKCVACKSSVFNNIYDEIGVDAFTTEVYNRDWMDFVDGRYLDCYGCHQYKDGELELVANMAYANKDIVPHTAEFFASLNPEEAVCGQCHNTVSPRSYIKGEEDLQKYDPYRYGYDLDARYQAMIEDGIAPVDEATGVIKNSMNHPQVEVFQDSIHQAMGLSCISCHGLQTQNEAGEAYTSHNFSGTIAQDNAKLEFCLTCHKAQSGLETVDDMRAFLKDRQDAQAEHQAVVQNKLDTLYDLILNAVNDSDNVDQEALQTAKDNYGYAFWYVSEQQQNLFDAPDGAQIAHDPAEMRSLLDRAEALCDEGIELLSTK